MPNIAVRRRLPRHRPSVGLVFTRALGTVALLAMIVVSGHAQTAGTGTNHFSMPSSSAILIQMLAKVAKLKTYYGGRVPKDGYVVVPAKEDNRNFLECDQTLAQVDVNTLKDSSHPDCGIGRPDPGPVTAFIKSFDTKGDVHIETKFGGETIAKGKWDELVSNPASGTATGSSQIKVGDFAVFQKTEQGNFATIFKLAPNMNGGGT